MEDRVYELQVLYESGSKGFPKRNMMKVWHINRQSLLDKDEEGVDDFEDEDSTTTLSSFEHM